MDILDAMRSRHSTRAFLDKAVDHATLTAILDAARWAPSGVNTQPWQVAVVQGATKQRLTDAILAARHSGAAEAPDYHYYPSDWFEPYKERRKRSGLALYQALNIGRDDAEQRKEQWENNYRFFGAPVGILFFVDQRMNQGSWLDLGMFVQNVMLAARAYGLESCPQASLADYPAIIRRTLQIEEQWLVACALSLGYEDKQHPVNQYRTEREPVDAFTHWYE
ncbi:MAG TPA: nitroreductase [Gammaproteobacteria bacterium]